MSELTAATRLSFWRTDATTASRQWIQSPAYDLAFFILAPLLGIVVLVLAPTGPSRLVLAIGAFVGIPHYLSTFTFYLWGDNREYHRVHWMSFFLGPVVIAAAIATGMAIGRWDVLKFIAYFWNAFHIARQSCGIQSIYRRNAGVTDARQKHPVNAAILATNACCAIWSVHLNPNVYSFLLHVSPAIQRTLRLTFLGVAVLALGWLAVYLKRRLRSSTPPTAAELSFLAASIIMFIPYLWIEDWNRAIFGVLVGHFVQYLALVWLVNRRRASHPTSSPAERLLRTVSTRPVWLATFAAASGTVFLTGPIVFGKLSVPMVWEWFGGALVIMHFYLDGLFWAFRKPHVRATIGPFLVRSSD